MRGKKKRVLTPGSDFGQSEIWPLVSKPSSKGRNIYAGIREIASEMSDHQEESPGKTGKIKKLLKPGDTA